MENPTARASDPDSRGHHAATRRKRRGRILHWVLRVFAAAVRILPLGVARGIGGALGRLAWHVVRRERRIALRNINQAFPEWSERRRREVIRGMFRHLGLSLFEILWLPNLDAVMLARTTIVEGLDRLMPHIDAGRGVVVFTAHCGNWEWLASVVGMAGRPISVLQRERNEAELNQFITDLRRRFGVKTIDRGSTGSARELMQVIRRGGILGFLIDQNIRTESVKVPFFGTLALTPIGPAKLAIRTGALVTCGFIERRADGVQVIRFQEPRELSREDDPIELTARITREIEEQIRRVPEQWVWFHERWRERPEWDVGSVK